MSQRLRRSSTPRRILIAAAALLVCLPAAHVFADPPSHGGEISIALSGEEWGGALTVESIPPEIVVHVLLVNTNDFEADFRFAGPAANADYQVVYRHADDVVPSKFDFTLPANGWAILSVTISENPGCSAYLIGDFTLEGAPGGGHPWDLPGGPPPGVGPGPPDGLPTGPPPGIGRPGRPVTASLCVMLPGDMMGLFGGLSVWVGQSKLATDPDVWLCDQHVAATAGRRQSAVCDVTLRNVTNATVAYVLRLERSETSAQIVHVYRDGVDVTAQLESEAGYITPALAPDEAFLLMAKVTPVGTSETLQQVAITAHAAEVTTPSLGAVETVRFDAILLGTRLLSSGRKARARNWREVRGADG